MTAEKQVDGIFSDLHAVGKFVVGNIGSVKSVRTSRSGMVVIECKSSEQVVKALNIYTFGKCPVNVFRLGIKRKKGVISGVPLEVKPDGIFSAFEGEGLCGVRRLTRYREGVREETKSMCLTFKGEVLPERVYIGYLCYRVRPYERGPLRCFCCQQYGHVAAVCRGNRRCGRCGKENCKEECMEEPAKCLHCGGEHHAGSSQCPRKVEEMKVNKVRTGKRGISYAEAVKRVEGKKERTTGMAELQSKEDERRTPICMDRKRFLAFIAMVINCAVEIQGKSERIKMVLDAAKRFLNVVDVSGEDLDNTLREEFMSTLTNGSGVGV